MMLPLRQKVSSINRLELVDRCSSYRKAWAGTDPPGCGVGGLRGPAADNNLVGLRPTLQLVGRAGMLAFRELADWPVVNARYVARASRRVSDTRPGSSAISTKRSPARLCGYEPAACHQHVLSSDQCAGWVLLPDGLPIGLEFPEGTLLWAAYGYEQATNHRRPPATVPALPEEPEPTR